MIDFKNIHRDDILLGNVMKVEEPNKFITTFTSSIMTNDVSICDSFGHIEPGKYSLVEEDAILLRYDDVRFIRLRNFNPYIGPLLLRTVVKKDSPNNGMLLFDSPFFVSTGNNFVDHDTIHSCDWLEKDIYTLKKLKDEFFKKSK